MSNVNQREESDSEERFAKGQKVALVSLVVVAFLAILKGSIGFLYGSIALLADAVNSFSDILASGLVWSGLKLSQKKPTERFPYGYYRAETLASLVVSALIIFSGAEILWEAANSILAPVLVPLAIPPLAAAALSMILYYALFRYKRRVGSEIDSRGLVADAKQSLADVAGSSIVFVGIFLSGLGYPIAEILVAILVGLIVVKEGLEQAKDAVLYLMDACLNPEMVSKMRELATEVEGITDAHDARLRRAGPVYFAELHITVNRNLNIKRAHALADEAEARIMENTESLENVTIHIDPTEEAVHRIGIPVSQRQGLDSEVSPHFARAPYFAIVEIVEDEIESTKFVKNPGQELERRKGIKAVEALESEEVDAMICGEVGEGPYELLTAKAVKLLRAPSGENTLQSVLDMFLSGNLQRIQSPDTA